jgi:hypothetical protein
VLFVVAAVLVALVAAGYGSWRDASNRELIYHWLRTGRPEHDVDALHSRRVRRAVPTKLDS